MSEATCSVCGGGPKRAIGHDMPDMTFGAAGFCLCGACAIESLYPTAQASGTARAAAPRSTGSSMAEEEVAAELEKLMGPTNGPVVHAARATTSIAPKRTKGGLTEEDVAAELEKLMGPPRAKSEAAA